MLKRRKEYPRQKLPSFPTSEVMYHRFLMLVVVQTWYSTEGDDTKGGRVIGNSLSGQLP